MARRTRTSQYAAMADAASRSAASFAASPSSAQGDVADAAGSTAPEGGGAAELRCAVRLRTCCVRLAMHSSRALACRREWQSVGPLAGGPSVGHEPITSAERPTVA
jgi:hypothetical protein